jgi:acyl-CoA reductase-like NAD-dependent aldehyde dehydrogenase
MFAELLDSLPAGLVTVLTGAGAAERALIDHPDVDPVSRAGSAQLGRGIAASAPRKPIASELEGVGAFIVCEDADLDVTVPAIAWNRLMNGGQACAAGKHTFVARAIIGEFVERMHQCVGFLDVDDPLKPATDLGPLISLDAAHRVEDQVGRTLREGATLILGGRRFRPSGLPGYFFQPTILTNVRPGSVPLLEKILGPVITISPVAGLAEAIGLAAGSEARLGASIYTRDPQAAAQLLEAVPAGLFTINEPVGADRANPLANMRHPAIRRLLGGESADEIRSPKRVQVAAALEPKSWWFPYASRNRAIRSE